MLEAVLPETLRDHGEVWIVTSTGSGHHVNRTSHHNGGGVLENSVRVSQRSINRTMFSILVEVKAFSSFDVPVWPKTFLLRHILHFNPVVIERLFNPIE